jgi:TPR repeat protein
MRYRRLAIAALCAALAAPAFSQEHLNIGDLRMRSEAGDKNATRTLAEAYYLGRGGVEQDFPEAARWYRKLATQGDARAQTSLGLMYARGLGFEQNLAEARRWWSLAAAQNDAGAQHNLGMVFLEGHGVDPDPAQALKWFRLAANRGHVLSQRILGLMLYEGRGTASDRPAGLTWLTIAAENGEEGAQEALKLLAGKVAPEELSQAQGRAKEWLKKNPALH